MSTPRRLTAALFTVLARTTLIASGIVLIAIGCSSNSATTTSSSSGSTGTTGSTGSTGSSTIPTTPSTWNGTGDGVWRRDANTIYGEAYTFDPCYAHQPGNGEYHYHENPVCLRYQLGDNITGTNVGTASATFTESTGTHTHSPILGWAFDGNPVYGPYGYSTCGTGAATSGVRRIESSYALRTDNTTTRTSLPAWAQTYQGITTLTSSQYGPAVSSTYPLGRYIEDYAYTAGSGDLDQFNGRFCPTPDFPNGVYAYYVTINANGTGAFPYYLGPDFANTVSGGNTTTITESTTTYYNNHALTGSASTTPGLASWLLTYTSQYAQILYDNNGSVAGPVTTWTNGTNAVSTATYADIQNIQYSTNYVYVKISDLASHIMGPWYLNQAKTQNFPNLPTNQNTYSKIPRTTATPSAYTATTGGSQGRWVNGVSMFNFLDFHSWSNSAQADQ